jgi:hypothetical protein
LAASWQWRAAISAVVSARPGSTGPSWSIMLLAIPGYGAVVIGSAI